VAVSIRTLDHLTEEDVAWTTEGYVSEERYRVTRTETPERVVISLDLESLPRPYVKHWDKPPEWTLNHYRGLLAEGLSIGAYEGDRLVGLLIAERRNWNKTLWIWEFHVRKERRGQGIGRRLMEEAAARAGRAGLRVMVAETQNTNVPAIRAYRALGFEVGSVDLSYYTNHDTDLDRPGAEVAVFMKRKL